MARAEAGVGRLDTLLNNAGTSRSPASTSAPTRVDDVIAAFRGHAGDVPATRRAGSGAIVNTSSSYGLGRRGYAAYVASKTALIGLTKTTAVQ